MTYVLEFFYRRFLAHYIEIWPKAHLEIRLDAAYYGFRLLKKGLLVLVDILCALC